jgi:hypothetical protein
MRWKTSDLIAAVDNKITMFEGTYHHSVTCSFCILSNKDCKKCPVSKNNTGICSCISLRHLLVSNYKTEALRILRNLHYKTVSTKTTNKIIRELMRG